MSTDSHSPITILLIEIVRSPPSHYSIMTITATIGINITPIISIINHR